MNRLITGSRADMPMPAAVVARMRLERDMALTGESAALDEVARLRATVSELEDALQTTEEERVRLRERIKELEAEWADDPCMRRHIRAALEE